MLGKVMTMDAGVAIHPFEGFFRVLGERGHAERIKLEHAAALARGPYRHRRDADIPYRPPQPEL